MLFNKKMPVVQTQNTIDFSKSTLDEKIDTIYKLLDTKIELVSFSCENVNITSDLRTFLQFVISICNTNFAVVTSIENKLY